MSFWTGDALGLVVKYQQNPLRAARALALLQVALHQAARAALDEGAQAIPRGASGDAAAAQAAMDAAGAAMLAYLYPQEAPGRFDAMAALRAAARPPTVPPNEVAPLRTHLAALAQTGRAAASRVIERALSDGGQRERPRVVPPAGPGYWRPTPPLNIANPTEPGAGNWLPWWTTETAGLPEAAAPSPYGSAEYWREAAEVLDVARSLTPRQKAVAEAWNLDAGSVTPPGLWTRVALHLLQGEADGPPHRRAEVMALLNTAMADAMVAAWRAKFHWWTMRPVTAIHERLDAAFLPHLLTPVFPSHVSGHAAASGAAAQMLAHLFPRRAQWVRELAEEAAMSRLYGGIHFRRDNEEGLVLGRAVAARALEQGRRPGAWQQAIEARPKAPTPGAPGACAAPRWTGGDPMLGRDPRPTLRWQAAVGATRYRLALRSRVPEGERVQSIELELGGTSFRPPQALASSRAWVSAEVRAVCAEPVGAVSEPAFLAYLLDARAQCLLPAGVTAERSWARACRYGGRGWTRRMKSRRSSTPALAPNSPAKRRLQCPRASGGGLCRAGRRSVPWWCRRAARDWMARPPCCGPGFDVVSECDEFDDIDESTDVHSPNSQPKLEQAMSSATQSARLIRDARHRVRSQASERYASAAATQAALAQGQAARLMRLEAADMVNTERAAELAGATRATVNTWIEQGRCIGLKRATRGYRLPAWQFEPQVLSAIQAISSALQTNDGWALLSFMESPHGGLQGRTPRQALEQGQAAERVIALAGGE